MPQPFSRALFKNTLIFGISFIFSATAIALITPVSFKTTDDTLTLHKILSERNQNQVLGASTEKSQQSECPEKKPVIGWIDFSGKKLILENLKDGQKPSACFANMKEAEENGFVKSK